MNRLTIKNGNYYCSPDSETSLKPVYDKLGKLEDLEEQLGCPLEVVFKALKDGIYTEKIDNTLLISKDVSLKHNGNQFVFILEHCYCVVIKNYKKTWWLKEDKTE